MRAFYHMDELRSHLATAKERLALERRNILQICPIRKSDNRAAYGFAYLQAERACLSAIKKRMDEIAWLPARLDTSTEINAETRGRMTRWIKNGEQIAPGEEIFGNAFVHALTRCAMLTGTESSATQLQADRIANLFRDLTCLVASIHCSNICSELQLEEIELQAPGDLTRLALDLTLTVESILALAEDEADESDESEDAPDADNQNRQTPPDYLRLVSDTGAPPEHPER